MRSWSSSAWLVLLAIAAACVELPIEEPAAGEPPAGAGGHGGGEAEPSCSSDAGCPGGRCVPIPEPACAGIAGCEAPRGCGTPSGTIADLRPCSADADCASGSCTPEGICRRVCGRQTECPLGFECVLWPVTGGGEVRSCIGHWAERQDPGITLCAFDRKGLCPEGRSCTLRTVERVRSSASCVVTQDPSLIPTLQQCALEEGPRCEGGSCRGYCGDERAICGSGFRCTAPCASPADCPFPARCAAAGVDYGSVEPAGLGYCDIGTACFDEQDCPGVDFNCTVNSLDALSTAVAECAYLDGKLPIRAPCTVDAECSTGICVGVEGARFCSSLCFPGWTTPDFCASTTTLQGSSCAPHLGVEGDPRTIWACKPPP